MRYLGSTSKEPGGGELEDCVGLSEISYRFNRRRSCRQQQSPRKTKIVRSRSARRSALQWNLGQKRRTLGLSKRVGIPARLHSWDAISGCRRHVLWRRGSGLVQQIECKQKVAGLRPSNTPNRIPPTPTRHKLLAFFWSFQLTVSPQCGTRTFFPLCAGTPKGTLTGE